MTLSYTSAAGTRPCGSMRSFTVRHCRSSPGTRLSHCEDSSSGSMGSTRPARYTLVARSRASTSCAEPSATCSPTSAMDTNSRGAPSGPAGNTERASSMSRVDGASTITVRMERKSGR